MKFLIIFCLTLMIFACSRQAQNSAVSTTKTDTQTFKKELLVGVWVVMGIKDNGKTIDPPKVKKTIMLNEDGTGKSTNKNTDMKWSVKAQGLKNMLSFDEGKEDSQTFEILSLDDKKLVLKSESVELTLEKK